MSRNSEKSQSSLHRFQAYKNQIGGVLESNPNLRPKSVKSCKSLPQAEKWRSVVLKEINGRLTRINDASLNDYQIRDINDELNKMIKELRSWEYHIKELGGVDYINVQTARLAGSPNFGALGYSLRGYKYFGRAKELEGVKEIIDFQRKQKLESQDLFNNKKSERAAKSKALKELEARAGPLYYGYLDEAGSGVDKVIETDLDVLIDQVNEALGDGVLENVVPREPVASRNEEVSELLTFERAKSKRIVRELRNKEREGGDVSDAGFLEINDDEFQIPSVEEIEALLVSRRKQALLERLKIQA
ncbi:hypothetical protein BABINDRAFT_163384 [Babjeviella inositovora NRRL Y-12698]|uniref:Pre-mRNA-splicing factor ISY1 n=1 Tax=Babjeviella inositovora NRRL Y-12698 TaxID=984486 RepID=A0A1E3QIZ7_9ASCO|nr:uncharacterized protein BABINDRAFT_163384 [Babjeviella inositovora NRRL Y-12698]ODQ77671.1 hypothetical protein BABINDRAFT_163384 [Babjeviella inositovora NRRL Y-12698]